LHIPGVSWQPASPFSAPSMTTVPATTNSIETGPYRHIPQRQQPGVTSTDRKTSRDPFPLGGRGKRGAPRRRRRRRRRRREGPTAATECPAAQLPVSHVEQFLLTHIASHLPSSTWWGAGWGWGRPISPQNHRDFCPGRQPVAQVRQHLTGSRNICARHATPGAHSLSLFWAR
jgi:hypothetical protein